jgi:predicted amidohydrolase
MKIVCAATFDGNSDEPDILVLPERTSLAELNAASACWPQAIVVGAVAEDCRIRAYLFHSGRNQIEYLKYATDGSSIGTQEIPVSQTFETKELAVGVLVCKDFQEVELRRTVLAKLLASKARHKIVCIPADMGSEWFPSEQVTEFIGAYVAMSNNLRPGGTRRASFILNPRGEFIESQVNQMAICHDAA